VVAVPLLFAVAFLAPNWVLWVVLGGAGTVGAWEYVRMALGRPLGADAWAAVLATATLLSALYWPADAAVFHGLCAATVIGLLLLCMRPGVETQGAAARFGHLMAAVTYCSVLFGSLVVMVRADDPWSAGPYQAGWLLWPMMIIWAGDTGAYFAGRTFGRRRLAPRLSPKKTVEGALGGVLASVGGGFLGWAILPLPAGLQPWHVVLIAVPAAVIGQAGDLAESLLKRSFGAKDSSHLLYGHGGMLDRVDALLFAAPWLALCRSLLLHPQLPV
jgi:phosphatidate cytidylyltransferase